MSDPIAYERQHVAEDRAIRDCIERVRRYAEAVASNPAGTNPATIATDLLAIVGVPS